MKAKPTKVARRFQANARWDSIVEKARREIRKLEESVAPAIKKIEEMRNRALEKALQGILDVGFMDEANVGPTFRKVKVWEHEEPYETYKVFWCDVELEINSATVGDDGEIDVVTEAEILEALSYAVSKYDAKKSLKIQQGRRTTKVSISGARIML